LRSTFFRFDNIKGGSLKRPNAIRLLALVAVVCLLGLSAPLFSSQSCNASNSCGQTCSITAPPGGSVNCHSSSNFAICVSYDASGNIVQIINKRCEDIIGFP